jgi:magnesium chelatase subunit I
MDTKNIKTLGDLRAAGWASRTVKEELAANARARLEADEVIFPGIIGYDDSAVPEMLNAILACHDIIILGERGQAKSRMIRQMVDLLDEYIPVVEGCEINDDPLAPVCRECRIKAEETGDNLPVAWLHRDDRFGEKLATPDLSMADIIGDVDPIKVAEGKYLSDERVIHFGLLPRVNRGIFAINELPDLAERVQVGLFNILEERDVQIKGFKVRLALDMLIIATANPEDYTHRGRIVTPLKDRYSSHVRTHYPRKRHLETAIVEQETKVRPLPGEELIVPKFINDIITGITFEARQSPEINQSSGVSVRMSISNYEAVVANARRRAIKLGDQRVVPRITDLPAVTATSRGRLELDYTSEENTEEDIINRLVNRSVKRVFDEYFDAGEFEEVVEVFNSGAVMEVGSSLPPAEYMDFFEKIPRAKEAVKKLEIGGSPGELAAAAEFILEGLHLSRRLNREQLPHGARYKKAERKAPRRMDDGFQLV